MKRLESIIPWLSLMVAVLASCYSYMGVQVAKESNKLAKETQELNAKLFLVEKRPYIDVEVSKIEGRYLVIADEENSEGKFSLELKNLGGLPARDIQIDIYYYDNNLKQYEHASIIMPPLQKILPGKSQFINTLSLKGGPNTTAVSKELKLGKLLMQVEIKYKSEIEESTYFQTLKRFEIGSDKVTLLGNLGEFQ